MISLSTADNALKNVYLEVITDQLKNAVDPFFAKIEQTTQSVAGNEIKKMIPLGINGGIGAGTEIGALPTAKENTYATLTSKLKNLYGTIEISDKAIRASRDEAGAFLNLLNAEMENLIESSKFNFRRMLYSNGTGLLGTSDTFTPGEASLKLAEGSVGAIGMRVDVYDSTGTLMPELKNVEIVDVDDKDSVITLSTVIPEKYEDETEISIYLTNSKGKEFIGLAGICDSTITTLYGIDRSTVSYMTGSTTSLTTAQFTMPKFMQLVDDIRLNYDGNVDLITSSFSFRRKLQDKLKASSYNTDVMNLAGGSKTITFNGVPVVATRFCPENSAYLLDSSVFHLHQLCDWTWLSNNKGEVLHQRENYATHIATLVKYCDLICDRPNRVLKLTVTN